MKRIHAIIIALALAVAVVAGTFAAMRSAQLGAASSATPRVTSSEVARQTHALNRAEAALRAQLRRRPPAVRGVPARPAVAQTVIYHRAPTIVHVVHRHGGDDGSEHGDGGGLDD